MTRHLPRTSPAVEDPFLEDTYEPTRRSRARRKQRRGPLLAVALLGVLLFLGGYLLGGVRQVSALPSGEPDGDGQQVTAPIDPPSEETGGTETATTEPDPVVAPEADWNLLLVNADNPLPADFQAPELTELKNGHAIDSRVYPALQRMMDDCRAAGLQPLICSSFRTRDKQAQLHENKIQRLLAEGYSQDAAEAEAARWVAPPGTSEHETGMAVDIVDTGYQILDERQEQTPVQQWLMAHCAEYGFILRYPTDKSSITGVGYEPWHYRYVGETAAREIMERGICLEEYLAE